MMATNKVGSKRGKRGTGGDATPKRQPSERETAFIDSARASHLLRPIRAEIQKRETQEVGALAIGPRHCDEQGGSYTLVDAFATTSEPFTSQNLIQLAEISVSDGAVRDDAVNAKLALLGAIAPQNELEAALALQMISTHDLSMLMLLRAKNASHLEGMREYGNLATKLTRTFTAQMKALSEWRRGGEQVVRHIHVYEGGQAVVAETVNVGGRENGKALIQPHGGLPPMLCSDPPRDPLSASPGGGESPLLLPRRGTRKRSTAR